MTRDDEAAARIAARVEAAAVERDPLAHADETVAAAGGARGASRAVVDDLELERVGAVADVDGRARIAGVLERVGQRLLHDPVGRQLDPDRELPSLALDAELDGKARLAELPDEGRHVVEPRLGRQRLVRVAAEHAEQAAHLGERAAPALLDRLQHLARRGVRVAEHAPLGAGLQDDHRDVVRDHVVQLTRDPRPFLDDRLARGHVALALGDLRAPLAVADDAADEQHHHGRDDGERHRAVQASLRPGARGEVDRHDQRQAEREAARRRPDRQPVQRAEIGDGSADDLRIPPEAQLDRAEHDDGDTGNRGIETPNRDCPRDGRRDDCGNQPLVCGAASEPDLELGADGEKSGDRPVELQRVGPDASETGEARAHDIKVNGGGRPVISRSADPRAPKDQPTG